MQLRRVLGVLAIAATSITSGSVASATGPGVNGEITFRHDADGGWPAIMAIEPDGSSPTVLADGGFFGAPVWSVDGTRMAFLRYVHPNVRLMVADEDARGRTLVLSDRTLPDRWRLTGDVAWMPDGDHLVVGLYDTRTPNDTALFLVGLDGSGRTRLSPGGATDSFPAVSNDGNTIAFIGSDGRERPRLMLMDADGSDRRILRVGGRRVRPGNPDWAPDDSVIVFDRFDGNQTDLYTIAPDGTDLTQITHGTRAEEAPVFSPDGTRIAFERSLGPLGLPDLWTVGAAAGDPVRLTDTPLARETGPAWRPLAPG